MPTIHEQLSEQFYQWEQRGRGWQVFPEPVTPEPPFRPFNGYHQPASPVDDTRRASAFSSFLQRLSQKLSTEAAEPLRVPESEDEPEPDILIRDSLVELQASLPAKLDISKDAFEHFLFTLSHCREPIAFELFGTEERIVAQFAATRDDAPLLRRQLQAHFPEVTFLVTENTLENAWNECPGDEMLAIEFGLEQEFFFPLASGKLDPFVGIVGALSELQPGELGLFQVLFEPVHNDWAESITASVTHADGKPLFVNAPELADAAKSKVNRPLFAAVVRIAIRTDAEARTLQLVRDLAGSLRVFAHPHGNALIPLNNEDYPFDDHVEDVVRRQSRRSGMLLNSDELIGFVHLPSSAVRSPVLQRDAGKTRSAPVIVQQHQGVLLGNNIHAGKSIPVRLNPDQLTQHVHIIGKQGTGKSTLLLNIVRQLIENGSGVAVLDPHGDLIHRILGLIPPERIDDVVLVDPADAAYSVGFNILSAHSELEKNLLASDLVSMFQRLSTSWGDQMDSVFRNAVLAFLESNQPGTLHDLRRFLIEPAFRADFLTSVRDPNLIYYWQRVFPQLGSNKSIGPIATRLNEFLMPKPVNYQLTVRRMRDQREMPVMVNANLTNLTRVEFIYGAAVIESEPLGAVVTSGGSELGVTPLTLPELQPGNFAFTLQLNDYESVASTLSIVANQTNGFRTNLVSRFYTRAMERANQFYKDKRFDRAAEVATEALTYRADDAEAKRMQRNATGHAHLARAESLGWQDDYAAAIKEVNAAIESLDESVYAKTLLADLTKHEQERIEAEQKRQAELAEQKRKQGEVAQAANRRQQNINRLSSRFYELNRTYSNQEAFSRHELMATNEAQSAATKINSALVGGQPAFEIVKYEWPQADTFTIQARHKIGIGYRECLIVGGNVQPGEMYVVYKVFEYENPPELKLLNGLLTATTSIKITSQDPQVEQKKVERFQERVREGVKTVKEKIQKAISE